MIKQAGVLVALSMVVSSCFTPTPKNGALACNTAGKACPDGYYCAADDHCWQKGQQPIVDMNSGMPLGQSCAADGDCGSGHCVDGVCCDTACTGSCSACDLPASTGTCSAIASGTAPHNGRATCVGFGLTCGGTCDGAALDCAYAPTTTICGASCSGRCDGAGSCSEAGGVCPNGYACGAGGCKTSCTINADCQPFFQCSGTTCTRIPESDCLDGMDNNGDGLADCADPTCNALVECVPTVGSDPIGTLSVAACADPYNNGTPEHQSFTAGTCTNGTCGCGANIVCNGNATLYTASNACSGGSVSANFLSTGGCVAFTAGTYQSGIFSYTSVQSQSCTNSGSAAMGASSWGSTTNFCATSKKSNTCDSTHVCVGKVATPVCVQLAGAGQTCPAGYTTTSGTYYSGYTDGTCSCSCAVTGNNCSGNSVEVKLYSDASCGSFYAYASICSRPCCNSLYFGGVKAFNGSTLASITDYNGGSGTCSTGSSQVTASTPTGASTICCK